MDEEATLNAIAEVYKGEVIIGPISWRSCRAAGESGGTAKNASFLLSLALRFVSSVSFSKLAQSNRKL